MLTLFKFGSLCQGVLSHCLYFNTKRSRKFFIISRNYVDGWLLCFQDWNKSLFFFFFYRTCAFFGLRPLPFRSCETIMFRILAPRQPLTWWARVPLPVVHFAQKLFCMCISNNVQVKAGIAWNKISAALHSKLFGKWKQVDLAARDTFPSRRNRNIRPTIWKMLQFLLYVCPCIVV